MRGRILEDKDTDVEVVLKSILCGLKSHVKGKPSVRNYFVVADYKDIKYALC